MILQDFIDQVSKLPEKDRNKAMNIALTDELISDEGVIASTQEVEGIVTGFKVGKFQVVLEGQIFYRD